MGAKITYLCKDLLSAEGSGQDQEGEEELIHSTVGFKNRQNLRSRDSLVISGIRGKGGENGGYSSFTSAQLRPLPLSCSSFMACRALR